MRYPKSQHIADVQARLEELREEETAWKAASITTQVELVLAFIDKYPTSSRRSVALHRIDTLEWRQADADGTSAAYTSQINAHEAGDFITAINGKKVKSFASLRAEIATQRAGNEISVTVFRDGKYKDLKVKLSSDENQKLSAKESQEISPAFAGASFANSDKGGIEVTDVAKGSVASMFGLRKGDIITGVNRQDVNTLHDLKSALNKEKGKISAIRINRNGTTLYITLRQQKTDWLEKPRPRIYGPGFFIVEKKRFFKREKESTSSLTWGQKFDFKELLAQLRTKLISL